MKRKTICVLGSTTQSGKEICLKYAREGYDVGVCYEEEKEEAEEIEMLILGMGSRVQLFHLEQLKNNKIIKVLYEFVDFYGHIDYVANCIPELENQWIYQSLDSLFPDEKNHIKMWQDKDLLGVSIFACRPEQTQNPLVTPELLTELKEKIKVCEKTTFNVREYGAQGDNFTDDTKAIQNAVEAAASCEGTVYFPAGIYRTGKIVLHPNICLKADPVWSYRTFCGAVLSLNDYQADCLLDVTDAHGVHIYGLCLDGKNKGDNIHGIGIMREERSKQEDMIQIEKCRIGCFTGDGIHFGQVWAYWVKHCQIAFNSGHGIYNCGTGGYLLDNFITANMGKGYYNSPDGFHITTTAIGNRIEWNRGGGMYLYNSLTGMISSNIFDRSGGTALYLGGKKGATGINITGNVFFRNSKPSYGYESVECNSHIFMDHAKGVTLTGNTFMAGRDDIDGDLSPLYDIVLNDVKHAAITGNSFYCGAVKESIHYVKEQGEDVIVSNNLNQNAPEELSWW